MCPHRLMLVLQVMTGVRKERDLLKETSIDVEKGGINGVTESEGGGIRNLRPDQEGHRTVLRIPTVKLKVTVTMNMKALMPKGRIESLRILLKKLLETNPPMPWMMVLRQFTIKRGRKQKCLRKKVHRPRRMERSGAMAMEQVLNMTKVQIDSLT